MTLVALLVEEITVYKLVMIQEVGVEAVESDNALIVV